MKNKLTNQDIYTRKLKSIVNKKNTILVIPPVYVYLLHQAIKCERHKISEILLDHKKYNSAELKAFGVRQERLDELDRYITKARKEAKEVTKIDHLITKISVWPKDGGE